MKRLAAIAVAVCASLASLLAAPVVGQVGTALPKAAASATPAQRTAAAREHFQRGTQYYAEHDYRAAQVEFERAYAIRPVYRILYNLGQVSYELRDYAAAERFFRAYLVEGEGEITPERRDEVARELENLRERVASITIRTVPDGAEVLLDERPIGTTPFSGPIRVSAGRRRIVAELKGRPPVSRAVDVVGGDSVNVELRFAPQLSAASATSAPEPHSDSGWVPWLTGIAAGVFAAGAVGVGISALQDANAYDDQLGRYTNREQLEVLSSNAHDKALVADVLLAAAVAGGVVTVIWLVNRDDEQPRAARTPLGPTAF